MISEPVSSQPLCLLTFPAVKLNDNAHYRLEIYIYIYIGIYKYMSVGCIEAEPENIRMGRGRN